MSIFMADGYNDGLNGNGPHLPGELYSNNYNEPTSVLAQEYMEGFKYGLNERINQEETK